jgi:cob(I)alamin adenosyltransferase
MREAMRQMRGLIHIYTGNGKGKTTAAWGLAVRAHGAGFRVCICQFMKARSSGEVRAAARLGNVRVRHYGTGCFIKKAPKRRDRELAAKGLEETRAIIGSRRFDLVVLDEIFVALRLGLVGSPAVVALLKNKPKTVEIVLTGRQCPRALYRYADIVTEMKEVKHPYRTGVKARPGIEY